MASRLFTALRSPPGWVLPGASVDMDFANARYYGRSLENLSCSRASQGFAPYSENNGILGTFAANVPRITDAGILIELAATNIALRSRDFGNAAWTATNVTVSQTSVGADGVTNGAARLTAGAINATLLQTVTASSAQRTLSFYIKRVTGSGAVEICQDGVTFTDISGQLNSSRFVQVSLTATQLNPVIGLRLATSGDAVDVDFAQLEAGDGASSPIVTTSATATRNADVCRVLNYSIPARPASGTLYCEAMAGPVAGVTRIVGGASGGSSANMYRIFRSTTPGVSGSSTSASSTTNVVSASWPNNTAMKVMMSWRAGQTRVIAAGGAVSTGAPSSLPLATTDLLIGMNGDNAFQFGGFIRRIALFSVQLPDALMQALTS